MRYNRHTTKSTSTHFKQHFQKVLKIISRQNKYAWQSGTQIAHPHTKDCVAKCLLWNFCACSMRYGTHLCRHFNELLCKIYSIESHYWRWNREHCSIHLNTIELTEMMYLNLKRLIDIQICSKIEYGRVRIANDTNTNPAKCKLSSFFLFYWKHIELDSHHPSKNKAYCV